MAEQHRARRWTRGETRRFLEEAFANRIAWVAARELLERSLGELPEGETRGQVERFLAAHPKPASSEERR